MKTNSVNNYSQTNYQTFKAGKVRVFADLDRTFIPAAQKQLQTSTDKNFIKFIRTHFESIGKFLESTKESLKLSLTTGRTLGETVAILGIINQRKNEFGTIPEPYSVIVGNGGDEYRLTEDDYPLNQEKIDTIKNKSGWDGAKLSEGLKAILAKMNMRIAEGETTSTPEDYGSESLFTNGKLPYEDQKVFNGTDKADWVTGFRNDGELGVFMTLPYDMHKVDERIEAYKNIEKEINELKEKCGGENIEHVVNKGGDNTVCGGRPFETFRPIVDGEPLSKAYDTKLAVKKAATNNDLVVAAGDITNNKDMLNPLAYLPEDFKTNHIKGELTPEIISQDKELADALKTLPFVGIVVIPQGEERNLGDLEVFTQGEYRKLIVVEEGQLETGIKEAVKLYGEQNPAYKEKIGEDLNKAVQIEQAQVEQTETKSKTKTEPESEAKTEGENKTESENKTEKDNKTENDNKSESKTDNDDKGGNNRESGGSEPSGDDDGSGSSWWKWLIGAGVVGGAAGLYAKNRKKNKENSEIK